jgi:hypothetical protein
LGDLRIGTDGTVPIAGTVEAQTIKVETVQTKLKKQQAEMMPLTG